MASERSYTAGKYALDLDGDFAAWVQSYEGGHCKAEVITEKLGTDVIQHKHLAGLSYEDISLSIGTAMSQSFYDWIQASIDHQYKRINNGALITADYNFKEQGRLNFFNALCAEVGFPALDAGSKDAAKMSVKFTPEYTRMVRKAGGQVQGPLGTGEQKKWTAANFKLEIDGCPTACKWVNKIEALTIKQKVVKSQVGEQRDYQIECANVEFPNLVITVAESHADEFYNWHEDFVIKGNCTQDKERGGQLQFLSSDLKPLFTLTFMNLGIFAMTPEKMEAASENIKRAKVEMYCEQIKFKAESGAIFS